MLLNIHASHKKNKESALKKNNLASTFAYFSTLLAFEN
jgi:hypothetical protein